MEHGHPLCSMFDALEITTILLRIAIKLIGQQACEGNDFPQRLLQIVRGHVLEILQLSVSLLEQRIHPRQCPLRSPSFVDLLSQTLIGSP